MCGAQVSILVLLANGQATVPQMACHVHFAILCNPNRYIFGDNTFWHLVVPLNNFAYLSNCPWMQGKSNKPLPSPKVCVWGGGK